MKHRLLDVYICEECGFESLDKFKLKKHEKEHKARAKLPDLERQWVEEYGWEYRECALEKLTWSNNRVLLINGTYSTNIIAAIDENSLYHTVLKRCCTIQEAKLFCEKMGWHYDW